VVGLGGGAVVVDGSASTQPISAASLPLPLGAATTAQQVIGNASLASIDGKLPATLGQKPLASSLAVVLSTDQTKIPVQFAAVGTPVVSSAPVAGVDTVILEANANRVGVECESSCTNTDRVFLNFGAAAEAKHKPLEACSSWQPPPGVRVTSSIHGIANSGTQAIVCVEY
jgi:hypothetical protein